MSLFLLIVGVLLFIGLVVLHEWGHFMAARRSGVKVEEFGIFFPPRLFKRRMKGGWLFTINLLPLGGFVRLKGEHDTDTAKGSFGATSLWNKTKIMGAGVAMNFVIAVVLFAVLAVVGMPKLVENQFTVKSDTKVTQSRLIISYVEPNSPASKAGFKAGDRIESGFVKSSTATLASVNDLKKFTKAHAGEAVKFRVNRDGKVFTAGTTLRSEQAVAASLKTNDPKGYLGVLPGVFTVQRTTWSAPVVAVGLTAQFTVLTFQGLGHALGGLGSIIAGTATNNGEARSHGASEASSQVGGPLAVFFILKELSSLGLNFVLFIIAYLSLTLALMNILPIPALDGGRLWLTLYARGIRRKPINARTEELINASGFVLLLGLIIVITTVDAKRFF